VALKLLEWCVWLSWWQFGGDELFFSSSSFLSLEPWYSYRAFKNSVMSSSLYLFWIWSLFFLFLFVLILMLLEVFFLNFIHEHLVSFNFCIQYGPYSFDWCFLIFCIYLFFLILSFRILFHFIFFPNLVLIFVLFFFFNHFLHLFYFSI
jgi:hypothetical protein